MVFDKQKLDKLLSGARTDENVRDLIELNERLLRKCMQKLFVENNDDAYSYGVEALYKAIMTFDVSGQVLFSTYAYRCIFNAIGSYIRKLNTNKATVVTVSFDQKTSVDGDMTIQDTIASDEDLERNVIGELSVKPVWYAFFAELNSLQSAIARNVVEIWYDSMFQMGESEIASVAGCSQSYVNRILKQFRVKLKRRLAI